ncbi:MAG TPA: EamA family transporter [Drouetiella sp.]
MHPVLLALLSAALFGASAPAGKFVIGSFTPLQLAGLLYLGASFGSLPVVLKQHRGKFFGVPKSTRAKLFGALLCGGCAAPSYMFALSQAPASTVSMYLCLESPFTALLAALLFKEHIGVRGIVGVIGTTSAAILLSWGTGQAGLLAAGAAAIACLLWSLDNNLTSIMDGIAPTEFTFWKGLVAGGVNFGIGCLLQPITAPVSALCFAIAVGAFCYGVSITCYIAAAQKLGATRSQLIFASAPFWGIGIAAVALGERLTTIQVVAAGILIASILTLLRDTHEHHHEHEAMSHMHEHTHDDGHHNHTHEGLPASHRHSHWHEHEPMSHSHPHLPDLHHRHEH